MATSLETIKKALVELEIDDIEKLVQGALKEGIDSNAILQSLRDGMLEVSKKYDAEEYYLPELVLAGDCMETGLKILKPHLKAGVQGRGKVITATVKGDLHDIGKNIVTTLLTAAGFEVIDLGKDIPAEEIVEVVKKEKADIVAVSALLTMTVSGIEDIAKKLKEAGLRDKVTLICGGAPLNQELATRLGADISCNDATEGIEVCRNIMDKKGKVVPTSPPGKKVEKKVKTKPVESSKKK